MQPWELLVYLNIPVMCLNLFGHMCLNLFGIWISCVNPKPTPAKICFWINTVSFAVSIANILSNSLTAVCT